MFDYYATVKKETNEYLIALDLPLYGESILKINLDSGRVSGSFLKRLKRTKTMDKFFLHWKNWLNHRLKNKLPDSELQHIEDRLILIAALSKSESVTMTLHGLTKESFFSRQTLAYSDNLTNESLKLELFTTECRNHAMH